MSRVFKWLLGAAVLTGLGLVTCHPDEVYIFAAASLTDCLKEIGKNYERQSGHKLVFNFGASNMLARQIEEGAPADLFFSADERQMDRLEKGNLILKETRENRLGNSLVIVVSQDAPASIRTPRDLEAVTVKRVALADPRVVPAGVYAREYLRSLNLWLALEPKIVPTANVRAALAAVESGNADAGLVYKTDALASKTVRIAYEVPATVGPRIRYPVAVVRRTRNASAARECLRYLDSRAAGQVFEKFGFMLIRSARSE